MAKNEYKGMLLTKSINKNTNSTTGLKRQNVERINII